MHHLQSIERACQKANFYGMVQNQIEHYQGPDSPPEIECDFRPITLQDILLCLGENFSVMGSGDIMKWEVNHEIELAGWMDTGIRYNLLLSPYDQSEEVLQFLAENLTK